MIECPFCGGQTELQSRIHYPAYDEVRGVYQCLKCGVTFERAVRDVNVK